MTESELKKIYPSASNAAEMAQLLSTIPRQYGIIGKAFDYFLPNILHESGGFKSMSESLNYSVQGLLDTFGRNRITVNQAQQYGRTETRAANQRAIANTVYGGWWGRENLGNIKPDDGWNLRGTGYIQLTGRENITLFTIWYNKQFSTRYTVEQMAELMRTDKTIAMHGACWFYAVHKKLVGVSDFKAIVKSINGGYIGLSERQKILERIEQQK